MTEYGELLARYKRLREVSLKLHAEMMGYIPRRDLEAAARSLDLWKKGALACEEDELAALVDHLIYRHPMDASGVIAQYAADNPPPAGSDEEMLIVAGKKASYSVFAVKSVIDGVGAEVVDVFRQTEHLLVDVSFGQTATEGFELCFRLLAVDGFCISSGAPLPFTQDALREVAKELSARGITPDGVRNFNSEQWNDLEVRLIRAGIQELREESSDSYQSDDEVTTPIEGGGRIERNGPCPCGSGKKYKKCCGR